MLRCPSCEAPIATSEGAIRCGCGEVYPRLPAGGIDFLQGRTFPDFDLDASDPEQRHLLAGEGAGVSWRVESFIIPLIRRYARTVGKEPDRLAVLDCGCGGGVSVDILCGHGMEAVGIDAGRSRHEQWRGRSCGAELHSADALRLPFETGRFDVVISSGLVEHIGVHEEIAEAYRARRLPDCDGQRERFIRELVRVLSRDGFILLDHPNGGFPADFWHGSEAGQVRWHSPRGDMLPRYGEIARYFRAADPALRLVSLSPVHRLRFRQVSRHRYGRALAPLAAAWLRLLDARWLSLLRRSILNPYLVTLACRLPGPLAWTHPVGVGPMQRVE